MPPSKSVCAVIAISLLAACSSRDTKTTHASLPPSCETADEDHVLEKVGRTVFWLEIKLLEQEKKASARCNGPQQ